MKSFFTALLLAGAAAAAPTFTLTSRDGDDSCMARGGKVSEWTVHDFDYHASYTFTTPSHQNSYGYVNFTLENPALDYRPVCSASSSQLQDFFYGTMVYNCDVPIESDAASFNFSRPSGQLEITQSWSCKEEGGRFEAKGGVTLDLSCETSDYQNPDWQIGQIYSQKLITCEKKTVTAPIEEISAVL